MFGCIVCCVRTAHWSGHAVQIFRSTIETFRLGVTSQESVYWLFFSNQKCYGRRFVFFFFSLLLLLLRLLLSLLASYEPVPLGCFELDLHTCCLNSLAQTITVNRLVFFSSLWQRPMRASLNQQQKKIDKNIYVAIFAHQFEMLTNLSTTKTGEDRPMSTANAQFW